MYIQASSSISFQASFQNKGFSLLLPELNKSSTIQHPDYSLFIPPMERRRMSEVLKMAISCTKDCLQQATLSQPDAIIVGTAQGCCTHTKQFLDNILTANGNLISPTPFISSTHNTIAGQISLMLKNHNYNTTHTQSSLSFEQALIDAQLCLNETCENVLVGASDEMEEELYSMKDRLGNDNFVSTYGSSFFIVSSHSSNTANPELIDVASFGLLKELKHSILSFLDSNKLTAKDIDLVLFSDSSQQTLSDLELIFAPKKLFDFQKVSGTYFTNSAFALHYGVDLLSQETHKKKKILICNNLLPENLGLMLLKN